ncbi:hypothetical protein K469DRAFT_682623 [Zopfia rhizophila CBS 207.26]|uniref:VWFA domain-containing protein n=1 Tax=Zopfia rhizophila CBS 207.26 TaxID=1314779 RepID=A0A6A6DDH5_9PEZI|nr:hypothetical protein K469DRAFT_682623 [Zopfia rhizophila CBS 207.26]
MEYAQKFPNAKKRILCLSDGEDTKSRQRVHDISIKLMQHNILFDSFCLAEEDDEDLQTLSYLTDGYKLQSSTMEQATAICELEPVLYQVERPELVLPKAALCHINHPWNRFYGTKRYIDVNYVSKDVFPKRKEHPGLSGIVCRT